MDDFGSGYSSLSYLQAFPFDKIKIDRAFVMHLGRNPQSAAIVRASSTSATASKCRSSPRASRPRNSSASLGRGLRRVQGYFIGKPLPIGQYATLVGRSVVNGKEPARKTG